MSASTRIRILEQDNNRRGDLFGRLMADLFIALGYDQPRLNVHKAGREIDLSADHRHEPRRAIAECKATKKPVGGDDVNKFVGALDAERGRKEGPPITGYFVSLAGFRETAKEQERQGRRSEIVLLSGPQVVDEMVTGRALIPRERATELAGRSCRALDDLELDYAAELLAHERGWIWAIFYLTGKARTHFVLIHSDGTLLARAVADEVIEADQACGGGLVELTCLNPEPPEQHDERSVQQAVAAYCEYLGHECGTIQLDGLPADSEVGSRRLKLESLFVPLHLDIAVDTQSEAGPNIELRADLRAPEDHRILERQTVGTALEQHPRLALLAPPGGGKSTLIKRLAIAYAEPERRQEVADDLPDREWLPLFFRCRELRDLARKPFTEVLDALSRREPVRRYAEVFRAEVDRALLAGRVLLLVDGLDEISDPGDRAAFVCTLRSALQAYPDVAIVVTSREAGFRHVAAHLAPVCAKATLSPFDGEDIRRLTVAWHTEVVGDTERVRTEAEGLATAITANDRIRRLAVNPLLLTTLLLVKRWVGRLPTRRAVLYGKAVEVLLMTWNVEGHEPLREDEALPQLCYVASAMMLQGVQKISRPRLAALLQEAREALPTELGFVEGSVEDFIHRVEDRSSLLMMAGHDVENGQLVELFEFRHLTFQEFLCARAMVKGWHPDRKEDDTLVSTLEPHFENDAWREVIPLAAVLGGKKTGALIERLTDHVSRVDLDGPEWTIDPELHCLALGNCLADEAAARPETIRAAIRQVVRLGRGFLPEDLIRTLARGRYGGEFLSEARKAYFSENPDLGNAGNTLVHAIWSRTTERKNAAGYRDAAAQFLQLLSSPEPLIRCEGALGCGYLCFRLARDQRVEELGEECRLTESLRSSGTLLTSMLFSTTLQEQHASVAAIRWLGASQTWTPPSEPDVLGRLFELWQNSSDEELRGIAGWALESQPLLSRGDPKICSSIERAELADLLERQAELLERQKTRTDGADLAAAAYLAPALIVAWYLQVLDDSKISRRLRNLIDVYPRGSSAAETVYQDLLKRLDQPGPQRS